MIRLLTRAACHLAIAVAQAILDATEDRRDEMATAWCAHCGGELTADCECLDCEWLVADYYSGGGGAW